MFKRVDHFALHFTDVAAAADYFIDTFGFERVRDQINKAGQPITYVQLGGTLVELTTRPSGEAMSGFHFCLEATDVEEAAKSLKSAGLEVLTELRPVASPDATQLNWKRGVFRGRYGEIVEIKGG